MEVFLYGWVSKLVAPIVTAFVLGAVKKYGPKLVGAIGKIPKPAWLGIVGAVSEGAVQISPEMFMFPGVPAQMSVLIYTALAMAGHEMVDQIRKAGLLPPKTAI